jgi:GT2 family glycosyltransferase
MELSFIVVTHKRDEMLRRCVESIYAQEGLPRPCELVVVDNGGDAEVVPPPDAQIKLMVDRPDRNLYATGGRNRAIELASGDVLVGLDDDARLSHPHAVRAALELFAERLECGLIAGRTMNQEGQSIRIEVPHPDKRRIDNRTIVEVPYFVSACWAARRAVVEQVGLYDERLIMAHEEYDLAMRIIASGYKIFYHPQLSAYHYQAKEGRFLAEKKWWVYNARNKIRTNWRYLPQPYPLTTLLVWSAAVLVRTGSPGAMFEVWRGLWANRATLAQERKPVSAETIRYLRRIGARFLY